MLEFTQCMRAHGVSDYANPIVPGAAPRGGGVNRYLGNGFNPNSPTYQAACAVCRNTQSPGR